MAPIKSVAVIGAGISGVSAAAHLLRHGFEVVVFERSDVAGGVWHFDPRRDKDPEYPADDDDEEATGNKKQDEPVQERKQQQTYEDVALAHAPPGPCYEGLMNNVPTTMMRSTLLDWPAGTPDHVTHREIEAYVQTLARETGAHDATLYNTRVEQAVKPPGADAWRVRTRTLHKHPSTTSSSPSSSPSSSSEPSPSFSLEDRSWTFDAVVVAAGHYHVPLIPKVPGLAEWKRRHPDRVMHSKSYRHPHAFRDRDVLLVGAGVSSLDIAKELDGVARATYQSSRGGVFDLDPALLPPNAERVGGLAAFKLDEGKEVGGEGQGQQLDDDAPIPGTVHLRDGRILSGLHQVIVASGYQTTYPFLGPDLETSDPTVGPDDADERVVITADRCVTHNLHWDVFYIPDPTLSFVGVPYYTSTFSMFDFQAEVVARVYAGLAAPLPSRDAMRAQHKARKAAGLKGKVFHSLIQNQVPYMDEILAWVNRGAEERGVERMKGVDEAWYKGYEDFKAKSRRLLPVDSTQIQQPIASKYYQE